MLTKNGDELVLQFLAFRTGVPMRCPKYKDHRAAGDLGLEEGIMCLGIDLLWRIAAILAVW